LSNFSKEFYHWLAVSDNEAQRVAAKRSGDEPRPSQNKYNTNF